MASKTNTVRAAILGASGYTGAELIRLLARHPHVEIRTLTADRRAGEPFGAVFPHLAALGLPDLMRIEDVDFAAHDLVFCCLPHGATQETIAALPQHLKVVDLSADFRLADIDAYAEWYGHAHRAPELQKSAVYGLTELKRAEVARARLVANPGCYPTGAQLPLIPLIEAGAVETRNIVIDAKSGVTGAGRGLRQDTLFPEVQDGIHAYGIGRHRHAPEIEQGLGEAAGAPVIVSFTPHLAPMNRGILSTIYVELANGETAEGLRRRLAARYADEIAFILPRTFRKTGLHRRLHPQFHLTDDMDVGRNSFMRFGNVHDVPCVWQIWTRKTVERPDPPVPDVSHLMKYVTPETADFAIRRVGYYAGRVVTSGVCHLSRTTHYFVREMVDGVIDVLRDVDWSDIVSRTVGVRSLSKTEIAFMLERMYHAE